LPKLTIIYHEFETNLEQILKADFMEKMILSLSQTELSVPALPTSLYILMEKGKTSPLRSFAF